MRKVLVCVAALGLSAPAMAQPGDHEGAAEALERVDFDRAAAVVERMVDAFLSLPVGGIAAAVDPLGRGGIYPHDTIGTVAQRSDPDARARISARIRGSARTAETTARAVARLMPVLQRSLDEMRENIAAAIESARD